MYAIIDRKTNEFVQFVPRIKLPMHIEPRYKFRNVSAEFAENKTRELKLKAWAEPEKMCLIPMIGGKLAHGANTYDHLVVMRRDNANLYVRSGDVVPPEYYNIVPSN